MPSVGIREVVIRPMLSHSGYFTHSTPSPSSQPSWTHIRMQNVPETAISGALTGGIVNAWRSAYYPSRIPPTCALTLRAFRWCYRDMGWCAHSRHHLHRASVRPERAHCYKSEICLSQNPRISLSTPSCSSALGQTRSTPNLYSRPSYGRDRFHEAH